MKFFNLFLLTGLTASVLTACDTKRNPYFGDEQAQFNISPISLVTSSNSTKETENPRGKTFILKVCLHDLGGNNLPSGLKFEIQAGKSSILKTTDINGCIKWDEEHKFHQVPRTRYYQLTRNFVSKNAYSGKRQRWFLLNPWQSSFLDALDIGDINPQEVLPITNDEDGFKVNFSKISKQPVEIDPTISIAGGTPSTGTPNLTDEDSSIKMTIGGLSLTRVKLNQETPYIVDSDLNLYAQQTYEFKAEPKIFVNTLNSEDEEFKQVKGRFKVTLAFLREPEFDIKKMAQLLEKIKSPNELLSLASNNQEAKLLSQNLENGSGLKFLSLSQVLSASDRSRMMTESLISLVQQTIVFETDMTAQFGLVEEINVMVKDLDRTNTRGLIAVTLEPIDGLAQAGLKADGVGYIENILNPGDAKIFPMNGIKVEADKLHTEMNRIKKIEKKFTPLELFFRKSQLNDKETAYRALNKTALPVSHVMGTGQTYDFSKKLELYLNNELKDSQYRTDKKEFLKSLCYKMFVSHPKEISKTFDGTALAINCASNPLAFFDTRVLDFMESMSPEKATKNGQTLEQKFKISKSFKKSKSVGQNFEAKLNFSKAIEPLSLAIGSSWYYTSGTESNVSVNSEVGFDISVQITNFEFETTTRRCLKLDYKNEILTHFDKSNIKIPKGYITCSNNTIKTRRSEDYFIVNQGCTSNSLVTDCSSASENQFRMILRGKEAYDIFEKLVLNSDLQILVSPMNIDFIKSEVDLWGTRIESFKINQIFPGVLTP